MLHEQVLEMCRTISAERDPAKLVVLIQQLRRLLAEEQKRIGDLIAGHEPTARAPD
jgi:hypothetical protein